MFEGSLTPSHSSMLGIFIRTNFNSTIEYKHQSGGTVLGEREQPVWRPEGWNFLFFFFYSHYWPRRCRNEERYNILECVFACLLITKRSMDSAQAVIPECGSQMRAEERGIESRIQDNGWGTERCS